MTHANGYRTIRITANDEVFHGEGRICGPPGEAGGMVELRWGLATVDCEQRSREYDILLSKWRRECGDAAVSGSPVDWSTDGAFVGADDGTRETARLHLELQRLRARNTESVEATRQLTEAVAQRERRLNQLLGERDQLNQSLARTEASLERLTRELGAATATNKGSGSRRQRFLARARTALVGLLQSPGSAAKPPPKTVPVSVNDGSGPLVPFADGAKARPLTAIAMFGLDEDERLRVLDTVAADSAKRDIAPLILTDNDDFAPLRSRGMVFEYFPPPSVRDRFGPTLDWDLYLRRRMILIRRKWRPTRMVSFGRQAAELLRLWDQSSLETFAANRAISTARPHPRGPIPHPPPHPQFVPR